VTKGHIVMDFSTPIDFTRMAKDIRSHLILLSHSDKLSSKSTPTSSKLFVMSNIGFKLQQGGVNPSIKSISHSSLYFKSCCPQFNSKACGLTSFLGTFYSLFPSPNKSIGCNFYTCFSDVTAQTLVKGKVLPSLGEPRGNY
jgi:hypothetical protein